MPRLTLVVSATLLLGACTHTVDPKVTPAKLPTVQPPIHARALLLLAPSFKTYTSQSSSGIHQFNYRLGESAARALTEVITRSFDSTEARDVSEADILQWLAGPADTSITDLLVLPRFEAGGYSEGVLSTAGDVRLRLDVRSYRAGHMYSWIGVGHSGGAFRSRGGVTGSALEQAIGALIDSLRAHRDELDETR